MRLILIVILAFMAGCGLPVAAYKYAVTVDPEICEGFEKDKTTQADIVKIFGSATALEREGYTPKGELVKVFTKGLTTARIKFNPDKTVKDWTCTKGSMAKEALM